MSQPQIKSKLTLPAAAGQPDDDVFTGAEAPAAVTQPQPSAAQPKLTVAPTPAQAQPEAALSLVLDELKYAPVLRRPYWAGVLKDCPVEQIAAGGVMFCTKTEMPSVTRTGDYESYPIPGSVVFLSADEVQRVLASMSRLGIVAVRSADGDVERASVERLEPGMEPAARYCWLAPIGEGVVPGHGMPLPPPLLRR